MHEVKVNVDAAVFEDVGMVARDERCGMVGIYFKAVIGVANCLIAN